MNPSSAKPEKWRMANEIVHVIPSELTYQRYLVALHYLSLEYQNYSARFSPKQSARLQWFASDIATA